MAIDRTKYIPRRQHYYFVHDYLRERVFANSKLLVEKLREETGTKYLRHLWQKIGDAGKAEKKNFISADDLQCFPIDFGDEYYGALIQLPMPKRMTEAYFAAVILPVNAGGFIECRFFTLEFTLKTDGSEATVVGGWNGYGGHLNFGVESAPEKEAFLETVRHLTINRIQGTNFLRGRGTNVHLN